MVTIVISTIPVGPLAGNHFVEIKNFRNSRKYGVSLDQALGKLIVDDWELLRLDQKPEFVRSPHMNYEEKAQLVRTDQKLLGIEIEDA